MTDHLPEVPVWSGSVTGSDHHIRTAWKVCDIALIAVVVIQGILAYRIRVFGYFDLPLILSIYYGFTLGRPVPSVIIGTSIGLIAGQSVGRSNGNEWLQQDADWISGGDGR